METFCRSWPSCTTADPFGLHGKGQASPTPCVPPALPMGCAGLQTAPGAGKSTGYANGHLGFYSDYCYSSPFMISDGLGARYSLFWGSVIRSLKWGQECLVGLDLGLAGEVRPLPFPEFLGRPASRGRRDKNLQVDPRSREQIGKAVGRGQVGAPPACLSPPGWT